MSKAITASLVPLFDRLTGMSASADGRLLDGGGLQQSLQLDLLRLFNVRNSLSIPAYLAFEPALLPFGLPDMQALSARSETDLELWAAVMLRCLARFESRLTHVKVTLQPDPYKPHAAHAAITAVVQLGSQLCRVNFDVAVDARAAALQALAA